MVDITIDRFFKLMKESMSYINNLEYFFSPQMSRNDILNNINYLKQTNMGNDNSALAFIMFTRNPLQIQTYSTPNPGRFLRTEFAEDSGRFSFNASLSLNCKFVTTMSEMMTVFETYYYGILFNKKNKLSYIVDIDGVTDGGLELIYSISYESLNSLNMVDVDTYGSLWEIDFNVILTGTYFAVDNIKIPKLNKFVLSHNLGQYRTVEQKEIINKEIE